MKLVEYAIQELASLRTSDRFNEVWQKAYNMAEEMEAEPPRLPRRARAPHRFQVSEPYQFATAKDLYRARYFETLDCAVSCPKNRITGKASTVLIAIESLILAAWKGEPLSREHLDLVHSRYSGDLDRSRLEN